MKIRIDSPKQAELMRGELFTIDGCGTGATGQLIIGGRSVETGKECKVVTRTIFEVTDVVESEVELKPAIL